MTLLQELVRKGRYTAALFILAPFYVLALLGVGLISVFDNGPLARAAIRFSDRVAGD